MRPKGTLTSKRERELLKLAASLKRAEQIVSDVRATLGDSIVDAIGEGASVRVVASALDLQPTQVQRLVQAARSAE